MAFRPDTLNAMGQYCVPSCGLSVVTESDTVTFLVPLTESSWNKNRPGCAGVIVCRPVNTNRRFATAVGHTTTLGLDVMQFVIFTLSDSP